MNAVRTYTVPPRWLLDTAQRHGLRILVGLPWEQHIAFLDDKNRARDIEERMRSGVRACADHPAILCYAIGNEIPDGKATQARVLDWQVRTAFAAGCAGAFIFAWTDEWYLGGYDIEDWDFGLTDRDRHPKPALTAVCEAFGEVPFPPDLPWPKVSVVVCSYNGGRTIRNCLEGLQKLEYPNFDWHHRRNSVRAYWRQQKSYGSVRPKGPDGP